MPTTSAFKAPKLGIGMVYSAALRPFLQRRPDILSVLEIEPQTLWLADHPIKGPFFEFTPGIEAFCSQPGHKLLHSVGVPLGGTRPPNPAQMTLLADTAAQLQCPWVSEHLSIGGTPHLASGFFLPPIQTDAGIATAVRNIRAFAKGIGRPVAIETGVAYFKRKPFEMSDGAFVARIAEEADCGILLDLHNVYCNERNGRIKLDQFLAEIPLERVWEIHLAGGAEMRGYWLDSHSGPMPPDLAARSKEIIKSLPNLGALNFEIYDTFLERIDMKTLDNIVDEMQVMWSTAGSSISDAPPVTQPQPASSPAPSPAHWEQGLTEAVWKDSPDYHPWQADEIPLKLYSWLARSFRGSMLTRALPRTIRYLLLRDGETVEGLLEQYYSDVAPKLYTPLESQAFRAWLLDKDKTDPLLHSLLDYDVAFMKLIREGQAQTVTFPGDPGPVFEALAESRLPDMPSPPQWELELLPDSYTVKDFARSDSDKPLRGSEYSLRL